MKRTSRLTAVLLAFCLAATTMTAGVTAGATTGVTGEGETHTVATSEALKTALAEAKDGDTIQITSSSYLTVTAEGKEGSSDIPWVINKKLTFEGGTLLLRTGGIALNNDVTFRNVVLYFPNAVRNAILANGHTLTLENVTSQSSGVVAGEPSIASANAINLFCGGYAGRIEGVEEDFDPELLNPGDKGTIIIKGNTNLQGKTSNLANIYAGNLCLGSMNVNDSTQGTKDGPDNTFNKPASIQIDYNADSNVGAIYACGAQQKDNNGKYIQAKPDNYRVGETVDITLGKAVTVYGKGSKATNVTYKDAGNNYEAPVALYDLNKLTVERGNLAPASGSSFQNVTLNSGAILNLTNVNTIPGTFTGGGSLVLGQNQTLKISGAVTGTTKVGIGSLNSDGTQSNTVPEERTYIEAPMSNDTSFQLLPYALRPDLLFSRSTEGNWSVASNGKINLVSAISFSDSNNTQLARGTTEVTLNLDVEGIGIYNLYYIPLTIKINGSEAEPKDDPDDLYRQYTTSSGLSINVDTIEESNTEIMKISGLTDAGYFIEVTVPGGDTVTGTPLSTSTALTVGNAPTPIAIPTAVSGLKWTGEPQTGVLSGTGYTLSGDVTATAVGDHTATAALQSGYQWSDGTTDDKTITWSIAKANGPAAPTGLTATAPTGANLHDGTIKGADTTMECADNLDFTNHKICDDKGVIGGLAAGTYYVRVAATNTHEAGAIATVIVPPYQPTTDPGGGDDNDKPDGGDNENPGGDNTGDNKPGDNTGGNNNNTGGDPGNNPDKPSNSKPGSSTGSNTSTSRPTTKPDGSTVATTTDKNTGTVTTTTKRPDGSQRVEEARKDGTVAVTEKAANGSTTQTINFTDGSSDTNLNQANGLTASISTDAFGKSTGEVRLPAQLSGGSQTVSLPIPAVQVATSGPSASTLTLYTGRSQPVQVAIPTRTASPGTVAVLVKAGGGQEVLKTSVMQNGSLVAAVPDGACVMVVDLGRSFADTNQHWARDAVAFTSARDLFSGTSATEFGPDAPMGRDMLMTVLARFDGVDTSGGASWSDKGMAWAVAHGISDGSDPTGHISREQLVTMLYRYAGSPGGNGQQALSFRDAENISDYAWNAVNWAVAQGILSGFGDNSLNPGGDTTRAQAATIFMQYAQYLAR